jgi:Tfp pilus assembly protein PilF
MFARFNTAGVLTIALAGIAFAADTAADKIKQGKEFYDREDYKKAINLLTEAIQLDPKSSEAFLWRGKAYWNKVDFKKCKEDFEQAIPLLSERIQRDPKNVQLYMMRGEAYQLQGERVPGFLNYSRHLDFDK